MSCYWLMTLTILNCILTDKPQATEVSEVIASGAWSVPVQDNRGNTLRGRLIICRKVVSAERRQFAIYVELQEVSQAIGNTQLIFCDMGRTDFRLEYKGGLRCELRDHEKKLVPSSSFPFSGAVPNSEWLSLPVDGMVRVRASPFGIYRPGAMALSSDLGNIWIIADEDVKEYSLSGTFTVDPSADRVPPKEGHVWRGSIALPAVKIVNRLR